MIVPLEPIKVINQRLIDYFGNYPNSNEPRWKLVWSEDVFEKRLIKFTDTGIELLQPEVREVKKFGYIKNKYVLTRAVPVPEVNQHELPELKLSYEPIWTFEDNAGNATQPKWESILVLISTINDQLNKAGHRAPYSIPEEQQNTAEGIEYRAKRIYEMLYGNETPLTDSLRLDSAVGFGTRKRSDWTH